jgi:hypothetical protein
MHIQSSIHTYAITAAIPHSTNAIVAAALRPLIPAAAPELGWTAIDWLGEGPPSPVPEAPAGGRTPAGTELAGVEKTALEVAT